MTKFHNFIGDSNLKHDRAPHFQLRFKKKKNFFSVPSDQYWSNDVILDFLNFEILNNC